jgi:hypothetical protein
MGIEQKLGNMGIATTTLEQAVAWSRTNAMWPMLFGLACCAIEMMSAQAAHYDMSRFGMELMRPPAPIGPDDRGRACFAQDGPRPAPPVRPDAGTKMGHFHGRLRFLWWRFQQLCHYARCG